MNILNIDEARKVADGKKSVIVTGVTGQDGSFMSDYLLKNTDYEIFGGARRLSVSNHTNVDHLVNQKRFHLINFDLTDEHSIVKIVSQLSPSYFINFAAQSFVKSSWDFPAQTWDTNTKGIIHILEAIHLYAPDCRFYNAGSSEEFGDVAYSPQDEKHPLRPRSPYGASKAAARQIVKVYRDSYNLYAIQGWLFNHEGIRRGEEFVTRKITKAVANIDSSMKLSIPIVPLELGNIDAKRDWSDAEDFVDAVWRMLNQENYRKEFPRIGESSPNGYITKPLYLQMIKDKWIPHLKEYVVSSGETHSIREFIDLAFGCIDIKGNWEGVGVDEKYVWQGYNLVTINPTYYRPAEVEYLHGDSTLIKNELGWSPKTSFTQLVEKMVQNDLK